MEVVMKVQESDLIELVKKDLLKMPFQRMNNELMSRVKRVHLWVHLEPPLYQPIPFFPILTVF